MTSQCAVFESVSGKQLALHNDLKQIATALNGIGVDFERWPTRDDVGRGHTQEAILAAYETEIARLSASEGYQSADVVSLYAPVDNISEIRGKFLSEHTHAEDEVRFFVDGSGLFTLHVDNHVYAITCVKNDLIRVPAGTKHWFDMGPNPGFTCIRLFSNPEGWVADYTGDDIANRFPRFEG